MRALFALTILGMQIFLCSYQASATTYYVKNGGNDNADGLSDANAWASISKVNSITFSPGDAILFKKDDTWRNEEIKITASGNSSMQITYGAYGTGKRPKILGSLEITSWTNLSGDIWESTVSIPKNPRKIDYGSEVFFKETDGTVIWGHYEEYDASYSNLSDEYDWTWNNSKVSIYSPTDPNSRYNGLEAPQAEKLIMLLDKNYITIDSLAVKYCISAAIYDQYSTIYLSGLRVTNCEVAYVGLRNGSKAFGLSVHQSNARYAYNDIHNCGRRGISMTIYETASIVVENVIIENNYFHNGFHTTGIDIIKAGPHTFRNITIRNNRFADDPNIDLQAEDASHSNQIYINDGKYSGTIGDIEIYNNTFQYPIGSSIKVGNNVQNISVYHNTFYGFNTDIDNYQAHIWTGNIAGYFKVKNNIFYSNSDKSSLMSIRIPTASTELFEIDYNLYYAENPDIRFFMNDNYPSAGNFSYTPNQWESYKRELGFDANSPAPIDPDFANAPSDFKLSATSLAISAGAVISGITLDYYGNMMNIPPDLGAIQYNSNPPTLIKASQKKTISIYPNPTDNFISITIEDDTKAYTARLFDISGNLISSKEIISDTHSIMPTDNVKAGMYILKISDNKGMFQAQKIIIGK